MAINIGSTTYPNLRAAINAAVGGNTIALTAGSYPINDYTGITNSNFTIPGLARFQSSLAGISGLTLAGAGAATTTITDLERIYVAAKDLGFGLPTNWTIKDLKLAFNFTGTSEYILQAGVKQYNNSGVLTGVLAPITDLKLLNLTFTGTHRGNSGSNGNYIDLAGATNLLLDGVTVDLISQQTYLAGTATTLSSGGSAFLFAQGNNLKVQNSTFKEAGYGNSITFYDSTGFTVDNNIFDAQGQRKQRGQIFSNSNGTVTRNSFLNGTHLDLLNVKSKTISITNNTFDAGITGFGLGVVIDSGQVLADLRNITATGNFFKDVVPFTSLISEASTGASPPGPSSTAQLRFAGVNHVWNPSLSGGLGAYEQFSRFLVGGTGNDILTGNIPAATANVRDFITGGAGNDTLTGFTGADAFVFTTPLNAATNVDTITDFRAPAAPPFPASGLDKIWLDDSIFTSLAKGALAPTDFGTVTAGIGSGLGADVVYDTATKGLYFAAGGAGSLSSYTQFATLGGTSIAPVVTDFVVF